MAKVNIYIDGTWLFYQCGGGKCLANATAFPHHRFTLDFRKLITAVVDHVNTSGKKCSGFGEGFFVTSIFELPPDFDDWPNQYADITNEQVEKTKNNVSARKSFLNSAVEAGLSDVAVFRPEIKDYIIKKLGRGEYQEKQVDTGVVALLVKGAITRPQEFHAVITGDSDIIPAIKVAYPEFTRNVLVITTHPDELNAAHRQAAFSLLDFSFEIPAFFLQDKADKIYAGSEIYKCAECGKVFSTARKMQAKARPYCPNHPRR